MNPEMLLWIVLFLPLAAAALIALFTRRSPSLSAVLSIGAVVSGLVLTIIFVATQGWDPEQGETSFVWLTAGDLSFNLGLRMDTLSLLMTLVVTGVASAIHIYSWGYMKGDPGFARFFGCLSLFTFSMLGIVLANNFLEMFVFWELVGVSSYLLIGFWFEKPSAADAGKKAFITNRLGDFGFILGILMVWATMGTLNFGELEDLKLANPDILGTSATIIGLLIFCGAMGKSAQFPLHVWLPDAMEGPTPVSALIHAATMVAAGVYMLCRVLFLLNPGALSVISWIGGFTALLAALIAVQQNDIKRILAYSTLSQLGYMVMAVGLQGATPAMFHLTTHAFFKALLFLGAGSVILAVHHEQDIWKMGGLKRKMPATFWTFLVGTIALAGVWPLSGFFSKDAILAQALSRGQYGLFGIGVFVAMLTSFYMFRLWFVVFLGGERSPAAGHAHESAGVITWPLRLLAVMSVVAGVISIEPMLEHFFARGENGHTLSFVEQLVYPFQHSWVAAVLGLAAAGIGFIGAYALYAKAAADPLPSRLGGLAVAMRERFYWDEIYEATVIRLHEILACISAWIDRWLIAGLLVRGTHGTTELAARALRLVQTGNLQTYALWFALGVALVLYLVLGR
jgi:NADH-quinone oxidoreductase subunit L